MDAFVAIQEYGSKALSHEVVQWGVALAIAARIHAGQVKGEIRAQIGNLSSSIDALGKALRDDLKSVNDRLLNVETRLEKVEKPRS